MSTDKKVNNEKINDADTIICPNCGAAIGESDPACPFCGYINISGAEEKFMKDMKKTEEELSQIPQMQKVHLKNNISRNGKIILRTVLISVCILIVFLGIHFLIDAIYYGSDDEVDVKAEMLWEEENYPLLDEMYAAGDYEGIIEFMEKIYAENEKEHTNHNIFNWEHIDFIRIYERWQTSKEIIEWMDQGNEIERYQAQNLLYDCMWFHYRQYEKFMILSEEEKVMVEEYRVWYEDVFYNRLKFTEEEADKLYQKAKDQYDSIESKACFDYADTIRDRIK